MEQFAELLETELAEAMEVKNPAALHRLSILLSERTLSKEEYRADQTSLRESMERMLEVIEQNRQESNRSFAALQLELDQRFHAAQQERLSLQKQMDRRFDEAKEDRDRRFDEARQERNQRFEAAQQERDRRFEEARKERKANSEAILKELELRFASQKELTEKRFSGIERRFNLLFGFLTLGFTILGLAILL